MDRRHSYNVALDVVGLRSPFVFIRLTQVIVLRGAHDPPIDRDERLHDIFRQNH